MRTILGISSDYHDSAAAVLVDGVLAGAVEEERFTRVKHDSSMPRNAIAWCLREARTEPGSPVEVVFYEKPLTSYERILSTHAMAGPRGFRALAGAVSKWSRSSLWVEARIERILTDLGYPRPVVHFAEHHVSHACSAFYPSPFESAAVLTFDAVGEWATSSIARGSDDGVRIIEELMFPDSLGLFYSAMTAYCGFEVNDGEYKMMGLAPYGEPRFADALRSEVIDVASDGSVRLDQRFFAYRTGTSMTSRRLADILDGPSLPAGMPPGRREADIARSAQLIIEEAVLSMAGHARDVTGESRACLAGGVALNCVANARLLSDGPFDELWIQPAAGDSGAAVGAAYWAWHELGNHPRTVFSGSDGMSGGFLGPRYDNDEIVRWLTDVGIEHTEMAGGELLDLVADHLVDGAVVGWLRGRAEFGPRALGHRSILADPRDPAMIGRLNDVIKKREGFRPFAPAIMAEHAADWFDPPGASPYMLMTKLLKADKCAAGMDRTGDGDEIAGFAARLSMSGSEIAACTHVDGTARVQTVDRLVNPAFHGLLEAFRRRTGCPVLLNTSFNRSGEPIVLTPADAVRTSAAVGLDLLVLEDCVVHSAAILDWAAR